MREKLQEIGMKHTLRKARDAGVLGEAMRGLPSVIGMSLPFSERVHSMPMILEELERIHDEVLSEREPG